MFDVEKRFTSLGRQVNGRNLALIKIGKGPAKLRVRNENLDFFLCGIRILFWTLVLAIGYYILDW